MLPLFFFLGYSRLQRSPIIIESWRRVFHGIPPCDLRCMAPWYHNLICGSIPHPSMPKYHANVIDLPWPLVVSWSILTYAHCLWILLFCGSQGSVVKSSNNWPRHTTPFHELATSIQPLKARSQKLSDAHPTWRHLRWQSICILWTLKSFMKSWKLNIDLQGGNFLLQILKCLLIFINPFKGQFLFQDI